MKKQIMILLWLVFASFSLQGETNGKGPYFWEVEKDGKKSYILGTLHMGVALEDLPCSKEISSHLENANVLLTETNMPSIRELVTFLAKEIENGLSSPALGFKDLSPESQEFFKTRFSQIPSIDWLPLETQQLEEANSVFLIFFFQLICLSNSPAIVSTVMPLIEKIMDLQIEEIARLHGIPQGNLDTMEMEEFLQITLSQTDSFDSYFSIGAIEDSVTNFETICTEENLKKQFQLLLSLSEIIDLYISGELEVEIPLTEERKIRQDMWFSKIRPAFQEQSHVFVAGGMGHFTESYNILDMLEQEGFSSKRFNENCVAE